MDCDYVEYNLWPNVKLYTCKVKNFAVTTDDVTVTEVSQNHWSGKSNSHVEVFYVESLIFNYLPKNIEQFFPNLKGIAILRSTFKTIRREDIAPFQQLWFFYIGANEITEVEGNLFESNPDITYLSFSSNPIVSIGFNLLEPLKKPVEIHFSAMKCLSKFTRTGQVQEMALALAVYCPPTFDMIERRIIKGDYFKSKVDEHVKEKTIYLEEKTELLEERVSQLGYKLSDLRKMVSESQTCTCK